MRQTYLRGSILRAVVGTAIVVGGAGAVRAAVTPVVEYNFPASWNGTGTAVVDVSGAGHGGITNSTPALSSALVPPGAPAGTSSITTNAGGVVTSAAQLLTNAAVAAAGGFRYHTWLYWDGTDSTSFSHAQKIVDYAGTESLQLTTSAGSAQLQMRFDDSVNAVSTTILPQTWYDVTMTFDSQGNAVDGLGNLAGMASLVVNGGAPITAAATKTAQGDTLNRPIGFGELGSSFGYLVGFKGEIYDPSVSLVPEPASAAMLGLAMTAVAVRRRR